MQTMISLVLGLLMFTTAAHGANEYVIVAADGAAATYSPGATLSAGSTIKLQDGAKLTLLSKSGNVIKLNGPYSGALPGKSGGDGGTTAISKIAKLVAGNAKRSRTLGATRAGSAPRRPNNVWMANVGRTRNICAKPDAAVLWRKRAKAPAAITVSGQGTSPASLIWPSGKHTVTLPPAAIRDNTDITIITAGRSLKAKLHVAPSALDFENKTLLLGWMASRNCADQVTAFIRQLHAD